MGLYINTNQSALNAQRSLYSANKSLETSFERLSSGLRINGAKDDAAGLSITNRLTSQVRGINQSMRNANDGISLFQTAEGALNESTNILQRIRELAVQSASDTNNASDRASLQAEVSQLKEELERIATTTEFNGIKLLNGDFLDRKLQIGAQRGETLSVTAQSATTDALARQARYESDKIVDQNSALSGLTISNSLGDFAIRDSIKSDDLLSTTHFSERSAIAKAAAINASSDKSGVRAIVGETVMVSASIFGGTLNNELGYFFSINNEKISGFAVLENDADGSLVDAINAVSAKTGVVASKTDDSLLKLTAQDGRNIVFSASEDMFLDETPFLPSMADYNIAGGTFLATAKLTLQSEEGFELQGATDTIGFDSEGFYGANSEKSVSKIDISERSMAVEALDIIDLALEDISSYRAAFGALQNRLESTINNLATTSENLSASRSRILDADFAQETAQLSRNQIIQQAGVSILSQANLQPQIALTLLN